jgi:hypothetical protein
VPEENKREKFKAAHDEEGASEERESNARFHLHSRL